MYAICACPRSGSSLFMNIMLFVFGKERIIGYEDPNADIGTVTAPQKELTEIERYLVEKHKQENPKIAERIARAKDMNPNGYHEMEFCTRGIYYRPRFENLLREIEDVNAPKKVCKIVAQGLARSDPRYISKIIYMVRDPRAVAKSQERLGRDNPMTPEDAPEANGNKVLIRSTGMFNQVTVAAAQWLKSHPDIPVLIVNYDELLDDPKRVLGRVACFLGEGDFSKAHEVIDPALRRSAPEDIEGESAAFAMQLFELLKLGDWSGIVDAWEKRIADLKANPPPRTRWSCPRLKQSVSVEVCKLCYSHEQTTLNLIKNANKRKIHWEVEPCPYECGIQGSTNSARTVQASIDKNHWRALMLSQQGNGLRIPGHV